MFSSPKSNRFVVRTGRVELPFPCGSQILSLAGWVMGSDATRIFNRLRLHRISRAPPRYSPMVTKPVTIGGRCFAPAMPAVTISRILSEIGLGLKTGFDLEWLDTQVQIACAGP